MMKKAKKMSETTALCAGGIRFTALSVILGSGHLSVFLWFSHFSS